MCNPGGEISCRKRLICQNNNKLEQGSLCGNVPGLLQRELLIVSLLTYQKAFQMCIYSPFFL